MLKTWTLAVLALATVLTCAPPAAAEEIEQGEGPPACSVDTKFRNVRVILGEPVADTEATLTVRIFDADYKLMDEVVVTLKKGATGFVPDVEGSTRYRDGSLKGADLTCELYDEDAAFEALSDTEKTAALLERVKALTDRVIEVEEENRSLKEALQGVFEHHTYITCTISHALWRGRHTYYLGSGSYTFGSLTLNFTNESCE